MTFNNAGGYGSDTEPEMDSEDAPYFDEGAEAMTREAYYASMSDDAVVYKLGTAEKRAQAKRDAAGRDDYSGEFNDS